MTALPPDYDSDPERWQAWTAPTDVQEMIAPELRGPVLDVGCGDGRLPAVLPDGVRWVGLDRSTTQVEANPFRPIVVGDMQALPFREGSFAEVAHLWCLYHLDEPRDAIAEAARVLRAGGRYFACTSARDNDPELLPEGYPPSTFDAEEAVDIVATVLDDPQPERWDAPFYALETRDEVRDYCRHTLVPEERAEAVDLPLWLTKRGVLVRATKR